MPNDLQHRDLAVVPQPLTASMAVKVARISRRAGGHAAGAADRMPVKTILVAEPGATEQLLIARDRLPAGHPDRIRLRAKAVELNVALAHRLARRYAGRGEDFDDLAQVASLALINAVDRFDAQRLVPFSSFAIPTILGALKRHFRDTAWSMRVPRGSQELMLASTVAVETLTHEHGRAPTEAELATRLGVDVTAVKAAGTAAHAYRMPSLNAAAVGSDTEAIDMIGATDPHYAVIDDRMTVRTLIAELSPRDRRVLALRFADDMTQAGIAAEIGASQMHVSRILNRCLSRLRVSVG